MDAALVFNRLQKMPDSPTQIISAHSNRQAMDWSLVLASQGIEHIIEETESGWGLNVAAQDYAKSIAHIRQYRLENRHWRWRRQIFQPDLFFDWGCLAWVFLITIFYSWSEIQPDLRSLGSVDGTALGHGEWWRLFTATWLHADLKHLAMNAVFGVLLLGLAMGRYGPGTGLLAAYLAGVIGNLLSWMINGKSQLALGSSGVVMGALGLIAVQSFVQPRNPFTQKLFISGMLGGLMLFVFLGLGPGTDVAAHLGSFVAGMMLGLGLALVSDLIQKQWVNLWAGVLFTSLVVLPWLWALVQ